MRLSFLLFTILLFSLTAFFSCSKNSVTGTDLSPGFSLSQETGRLIGAGRMDFNPVDETIMMTPLRDSQFHLNVTWLLASGCPGGCFTYRILSVQDNIWTIELTLENPTSIQVYDVRIFLFDILGTKVLNPDGYSDYYTDVVWVPFLNFRKEDPERAFPIGPGATDSEILKLDFTNSPGGGIEYYIEAGIGEQFTEPVQIDPAESDGVFFSNYPMGGRIRAYVHDHQQDPVVELDASAIGLSDSEPMYDDGLHEDEAADDGIFGTDLMIPTVEKGLYTVYIEAYDAPGWPMIKRPVDLKVYPMPEMIFIPEGSFQMGNGPSDPFNADERVADEKPLHTHPTAAYFIGKYEVTNEQYAAFVENNGYSTRAYWSQTGWLVLNDLGMSGPFYWNDARFSGEDKLNYPVIGLCWYEAEAYCNWLSAVTQQTWRLPSEAEWERAARGDADDRPFPWGNTWNDNKANSARDTIDTDYTSPVGRYSPTGDSPWGCADMIGNANEWTTDWYQSDIYDQYASGDYTPPASGAYKVMRGACWWMNWKIYLRNSFRWNNSLIDFDDANGLRVVRVPD
jgi:formylglycine-generating enzyme required for sulfatase activity